MAYTGCKPPAQHVGSVHSICIMCSACSTPCTAVFSLDAGLQSSPTLIMVGQANNQQEPQKQQQQQQVPQQSTQVIKPEPCSQPSSTTACDCGLPAVPCDAPGCSASKCWPCDRKRKQQDTFAGFQSCSLRCCKKTHYCEQHRSMLKRCIVCEELCCNKTSHVTVCTSCHNRPGFAA